MPAFGRPTATPGSAKSPRRLARSGAVRVQDLDGHANRLAPDTALKGVTNAADLFRTSWTRNGIVKTRRVRWFPWACGLLLCLILAGGIHARYAADLDAVRRLYISESREGTQQVAGAVERTFHELYQGLWTIARLPGVRTVNADAPDLDRATRQTVQELYNNIAANVALSRIDLVPLDPDGGNRDGAAGPGPGSIVRFDHALNDDAGPARLPPSVRNGSEALDRAAIAEMGAMRGQLNWFHTHVPSASAVAALAPPALTGPEVLIRDDTRLDPAAPNDADRSGLIYSVPFFDDAGLLKGSIAGVILTPALRDLLPDGHFVLRHVANGYTATSFVHGVWETSAAAVQQATGDSRLIYSQVFPLEVVDASGPWVLWAGRADAEFWQRADVRAAGRAARSSSLLLTLFGICLGVALWIAEQRRRAAAEYRHGIETALADAEAANHAKDDFLATMSHELRTPLNGIFGMTELAADADDANQRREFLDRARACATNLLSLVDDVLEFSNLQAGHATLATSEFAVAEVVRSVLDTVASESDRKGIKLAGVVDDALPSHLHGDPARLQQILSKLVANAVKFTDRGSVVVRLGHEPTIGRRPFDDQITLVCSVADTGMGIPRDEHGTIFRAFHQVDGSDRRRHGGAGLGLAIVDRLVAFMGGDIRVESRVGRGSTFTCRIPLRRATHPAGAARAVGGSSAGEPATPPRRLSA